MKVMTPDEYAAVFELDLHAWNITTPRSQQATSGIIGISDIGTCMEQTRRVITGAPVTDSPESLPAIVGSWVDGGSKVARALSNPHLRFDMPVMVTLSNGLEVPGTLDEEDETEPAVTDIKSKDGLAEVRKDGGGTQHRFQRQLYYAARVQSGVLPKDGVTRNVYVDRSGQDSHVHVEQEPFRQSAVDEATRWMDVVLDAVKHDEEAPKDKPRPWCRRFCQFYTDCRAGELEVGWIGNANIAARVDAYGDAVTDAKDAEQRKKEIRPDVSGITGFTERYTIQTTQINGPQRSSTRIEVTPK